jgi:hypothetical protein
MDDLICPLCGDLVGFEDDDELAIVFSIPQVLAALEVAHQRCLHQVLSDFGAAIATAMREPRHEESVDSNAISHGWEDAQRRS